MICGGHLSDRDDDITFAAFFMTIPVILTNLVKHTDLSLAPHNTQFLK